MVCHVHITGFSGQGHSLILVLPCPASLFVYASKDLEVTWYLVH